MLKVPYGLKVLIVRDRSKWEKEERKLFWHPWMFLIFTFLFHPVSDWTIFNRFIFTVEIPQPLLPIWYALSSPLFVSSYRRSIRRNKTSWKRNGKRHREKLKRRSVDTTRRYKAERRRFIDFLVFKCPHLCNQKKTHT